MRNLVVFMVLISFSLHGFATEKRDLLQKEAAKIDLAASLVKNFSELNFPTYKDRSFWNNLPAEIRNEYISDAEEALDYNWPVVNH